MAEPEAIENLVVGSGEGGKSVAWHLARQGRPVVCVERALIGGACPNVACLPSKNEVYSAKVAHLVRHGASYGVQTGAVSIDMRRVLRRQGIPYRLASLPMASVLRTHTTGEDRGLMKLLLHAQSDQILGFTMLGPQAGEVVAVVQTAMLGGLPYTLLRDAIFAHPTMSEGLNRLLADVEASVR